MTADTESQRDVLCLAGGTGLAPIKAIIEAIIHSPAPAAAARDRALLRRAPSPDLYDLAELQDMEVGLPVAAGHPGVSDEPASDDVMSGTVPELAAKARGPTATSTSAGRTR